MQEGNLTCADFEDVDSAPTQASANQKNLLLLLV